MGLNDQKCLFAPVEGLVAGGALEYKAATFSPLSPVLANCYQARAAGPASRVGRSRRGRTRRPGASIRLPRFKCLVHDLVHEAVCEYGVLPQKKQPLMPVFYGFSTAYATRVNTSDGPGRISKPVPSTARPLIRRVAHESQPTTLPRAAALRNSVRRGGRWASAAHFSVCRQAMMFSGPSGPSGRRRPTGCP